MLLACLQKTSNAIILLIAIVKMTITFETKWDVLLVYDSLHKTTDGIIPLTKDNHFSVDQIVLQSVFFSQHTKDSQ